MSLPENLSYTKEHEWARREDDGTIIVGITAHAVEQLGDITAVTLPDVDDEVDAGERFGDIDSVKAVSDLYAPIAGKVVRINESLEDEPEQINDDPYGKGWMVAIAPSDADAFGALMSAADYAKLIAEG